MPMWSARPRKKLKRSCSVDKKRTTIKVEKEGQRKANMSKIKFGAVRPKSKRTNQTGFVPNPLSLSVPEPEFETWLRDSGYLEILDQRTTDLHRHRLSATTKPTAAAATATGASDSIGFRFVWLILSRIWTLVSLLTFNPFSKLASNDFSADTPPWALAFFGSLESYSFPSSPCQARLRVQENVKRFARNYASLFVVFFACSLYQLPIALFGLVLCLGLWEIYKFGVDRWKLDRYPVIRQTLFRIAQCATAMVLIISNVQLAIFFALGVSYAVMLLHSSFRKLTSVKQHATASGHGNAHVSR